MRQFSDSVIPNAALRPKPGHHNLTVAVRSGHLHFDRVDIKRRRERRGAVEINKTVPVQELHDPTTLVRRPWRKLRRPLRPKDMALPAAYMDCRRLDRIGQPNNFFKKCTAPLGVTTASATHLRTTRHSESAQHHRGDQAQRSTANPAQTNQRCEDRYERCEPTTHSGPSNETIPRRRRRQIPAKRDGEPNAGYHAEPNNKYAYQRLTVGSWALRLISRHPSNIRKESGSKRFFRCVPPGRTATMPAKPAFDPTDEGAEELTEAAGRTLQTERRTEPAFASCSDQAKPWRRIGGAPQPILSCSQHATKVASR